MDSSSSDSDFADCPTDTPKQHCEKRLFSERDSPGIELCVLQKPPKMASKDEFDDLFSTEKGFHAKSADFARGLNQILVPNFAEQAAQLIKQTCDPMIKNINSNAEKADALAGKIYVVEQRQNLAKSKMAELKERILECEARQRANNLIFCGIPEQAREKAEDLYEKVKEQMLKIPRLDANNIAIESCFRRGQKNEEFGPRETVVTFLRYSAKQLVSGGRDHFSAHIKVKQDLPYELACVQRALMPIKLIADQMPQFRGKVRVTRGNIIIDNKPYNLTTLHEIPKEIDIAKGSWKQSDDVLVYFSVRTIFSNFRWAPLTINGLTFENCEKYIQYRKADLFNDEETIVAILESHNPYEIKRLGKKVKGFNEEEWNAILPDVAYDVNKLKYVTHKDMGNLLMSTHPKRLAEATDEDPWGCGLHLNHRDVLDVTKWKRNPGVMGDVLMRIRSDLMAMNTPTVQVVGN